MTVLDDYAGGGAGRGSPPNPYDAYLGALKPGTELTMRRCLDRLAALLAGEALTPEQPPARNRGSDTDWWNLTTAEIGSVVAALNAQGWAPATVNKHLVALRKVLHTCWLLGLMDADTKNRACEIAKGVTGTRLLKGRAIASTEMDLLLGACSDGTPKGARDGAVIALLYATGMRRFEVAKLTLENWSEHDRALRVVGKGDKEREVPVAADVLPWLTAWLTIRQWSPGPLFCPVRKNGKVAILGLTGQTIWDIVEVRGRQVGLTNPPRPHDFRRTNVGDLLDRDVDMSTVQKIAGHASPATTARYDKRGSRTMLAAVDKLHLRQPGGDGRE